MDYPYRYFKAIIITTIVVICRSQSDRDIILTPKLSDQIKGKTLYYKPSEGVELTQIRVPWEQILKHLTYFTLYSIPTEKNHIGENPNYKTFMNASYIKSDYHAPNFGDIITLAEGRLEKSSENTYKFIEGKCLDQCKEKEIAQWLVQKIRHRDTEQSFRYEIKFSINPFHMEENVSGKDGITKRTARSFILRDYDYPKNFQLLNEHTIQRRFDDNQNYLAKLNHFNDVFMQPYHIDSNFYTSDNPTIPELNIGEYIREPIHRKMQYSKPPPPINNNNRYISPTTYRPNYNLKFSQQPHYDHEINLEVSPIKTPIMTTHLHHHYYIAGSKFSEEKEHDQFENYGANSGNKAAFEYELSQIQTPIPIKHQIGIPLNYGNQLTRIPYPIPITSPIIPAPQMIYTQYASDMDVPAFQIMQTVPHIHTYLYNLQNSDTTTKPKTYDSKPFLESPKYEGIRYSELDPLYKDFNLKTDNIIKENPIEPTSSSTYSISSHDMDLEIERPSDSDQNTEPNQFIKKDPDTIIAQLPAPEKDSDITIPDIETADIPKSSPDLTIPYIGPAEIVKTSDEQDTNPSIAPTASSAKSVILLTEEIIAEDNQFTKAKPHFKSTNERPVLKWKPKRPKAQKVNIQDANTQDIKTKIPSSSDNDNKNMSSSNPNKISNKFTFERVPSENTSQIIYTVTPNKDVDEVYTKQSFSTSISIKVGTNREEMPFVPTISVPNVELYAANLERIHTNASDVKLFKASDNNEHPSDEEEELTQSIVEHARNLGN